MPVPVFVRLSYLRHNLGIPISEAAQKLGISQSYLFELEEFTKVAEPYVVIHKKKPYSFARTVEEYARFLSNSLQSPLTFSDYELENIGELLLEDSFFHSIIRYISNVFVDLPITPNEKGKLQPGYSSFYKWFIYRAICPAEDNIIYAPNDPVAAEAMHYVFTRAFTRGIRRRKKIIEASYTPFAQTAQPSSPIGKFNCTGYPFYQGVLYSSIETHPRRWPYFIYLLLYICIKKMHLRFSPPNKWPTPTPISSLKTLKVIPQNAPPANDAFLIITPKKEITVFFNSIFSKSSEYYSVEGDLLTFSTK
ncbi:MAG: helix-turn-helix transcriptional regulator [Firmicutes bacterium]|nr:helix-turn-helix transcriptional regulator [Bacillota bacterium]